ncbi:hypothetical protein Taro_040882 [Colocasia esculenta]|uniref:Uncharacterized protein n=1 Tax=Colocasia esculenta TaxID=4460 RepID=A0A843WU99_COLES|nr:hypothetical protein [Colocasia esculenta]
MPHPILPLLL